jgi:hypothetical protein
LSRAYGELEYHRALPTKRHCPAPFTFAIKNTGNAKAYPYIFIKDTVGPNPWANIASLTYDPPNLPDTHWLYPGETWTVTVAPVAGVQCGGSAYHVFLGVDNAQGTSQTMTFTDTIQ